VQNWKFVSLAVPVILEQMFPNVKVGHVTQAALTCDLILSF